MKTQIVTALSGSSKLASIKKLAQQKQRRIITLLCREFAIALKS